MLVVSKLFQTISHDLSQSYLGDSGSHGTVLKRIAQKTNWMANGSRHPIGPPTNDNPFAR